MIKPFTIICNSCLGKKVDIRDRKVVCLSCGNSSHDSDYEKLQLARKVHKDLREKINAMEALARAEMNVGNENAWADIQNRITASKVQVMRIENEFGVDSLVRRVDLDETKTNVVD